MNPGKGRGEDRGRGKFSPLHLLLAPSALTQSSRPNPTPPRWSSLPLDSPPLPAGLLLPDKSSYHHVSVLPSSSMSRPPRRTHLLSPVNGALVPWPQAGPKSCGGPLPGLPPRRPSARLRSQAEAPAKSAEPWVSPLTPCLMPFRGDRLDRCPMLPCQRPGRGAGSETGAQRSWPVLYEEEALEGWMEADLPRGTGEPDTAVSVSMEVASKEPPLGTFLGFPEEVPSPPAPSQIVSAQRSGSKGPRLLQDAGSLLVVSALEGLPDFPALEAKNQSWEGRTSHLGPWEP